LTTFLAGAIAVTAIVATSPVSAEDCLRWRTAFASMRSGTVTIVSGDQKVQFPVKVADDISGGLPDSNAQRVTKSNIRSSSSTLA
jgi:hypothetical protein